jgi:hypothetical protein
VTTSQHSNSCQDAGRVETVLRKRRRVLKGSPLNRGTLQ